MEPLIVLITHIIYMMLMCVALMPLLVITADSFRLNSDGHVDLYHSDTMRMD